MSGPTKGMVAGQPIQTGVVSKEYEDGFSRTFGERKPARGRYVYRKNPETGDYEAVNVSQGFVGERRDGNRKSEEEIYGKVQATDGADLSTRRRHREYMERNGLTMASDYTQQWERQKQERERALSGDADTRERREAIGRAVYQKWKP